LIANGFFNPKLSALFYAIWITARFSYGSGYAKGPKGRIPGFFVSTFGGYLPLIALTGYHSYKLLRGSI
jgi:hypothetical protein